MNKIVISSSFFPLLENQYRYLILCGGRGSGKSEFAARKLYIRGRREGGHRFLILRKVRKSTKESVIKVFQRLLADVDINYVYNKSDHIIAIMGANGKATEFIFDGLDDPEKIKSIKAITGIWIEEATEFTERDFNEVDLIFREPGPSYKQIILTFNPDEALAPWLKKRFFDHLDPQAFIHPSTVEDNPIAEIRAAYREQLEAIRDDSLREIYRYGRWALPKGRIYNWDVAPLPRLKFDDVFYGGDFGYSVNPSAVVKIYRKANEFWLEEILYEAGLTNQDIAEKLRLDPAFDRTLPSWWDSAEQKSIEELYRLGISALPAVKGPDSVRAGIDFIKSQVIHIVAGSENIVREAARYKWREDKHGNTLAEPVKFEDHAMDAIRYGIFSYMRQAGASIEIVERDVYPE